MESSTERIHRVLLLWLELQQAVDLAPPPGDSAVSTPCVPWNTGDAAVCEIWGKLTAPSNQLALEEWLCQSAEGQPAEWAREALKACRERAKTCPKPEYGD
jgi:hypothetical protein